MRAAVLLASLGGRCTPSPPPDWRIISVFGPSFEARPIATSDDNIIAMTTHPKGDDETIAFAYY